jgi:hypothetical protein
VSVRQGARAWQASSRPLLQLTVSREPKTGVCTIALHNAGGGAALGTTFLFVSGSWVARGYVGILRSGRELVIKTNPMPDVATNPGGGLVSCYEDDEGRVAQTFFLTKVRRRYRKRLWRDVPTDEKMFAEQYPSVSLDDLNEAAVSTPMLAQP